MFNVLQTSLLAPTFTAGRGYMLSQYIMCRHNGLSNTRLFGARKTMYCAPKDDLSERKRLPLAKWNAGTPKSVCHIFIKRTKNIGL